MQALNQNDVVEALTAWELRQACKVPVSFRSLAMSSTSRAAIAAGSGITSQQRMGVLLKAAQALGMTGIIEV